MIAFRDVYVAREQKVICAGCDLKIEAKERVVIVGASGSGKTTLLRLIAGFETPQSGEIYIDGALVTQDETIMIEPEKRGVGMVFQSLALWPHMNVEENIAFGLKMQGIAKKIRSEKVKAMLDMVGLVGYEGRKIQTLSGGEQQRVALARSLVLSPKVLLMDEPLSSLDSALNARLRGEIVRLQEQLGFTLIYVTHNKEEAQEVATRLILMEDMLYSKEKGGLS